MGINSIVELPYFDVEAFKGSEWYYWGISGNIKILYVLAGVLGPLGLKWIYDRLCALVNDRIEKAEVLARKAWMRTKPDKDLRKSRQKVIAFLVRKGYSWDTARAACKSAESKL